MSVEVLLFGAHPDDIEWGAGGICLLLQREKISFALIDLTRGEMGSRGTPAERALEAEKAAHMLGATARENLNLPDCGLEDTPETRQMVARAIRRHRPALVLAPYWEDRHPDHAAAGWMVKNASLFCTLRQTSLEYPPHKPQAFLHYLLHNYERPTTVVDVTDVYHEKLRLMRLHETQFAKPAAELGLIPQGLSDYLFGLESRDRFFGSLIGAHYGEALVSDRPLRMAGLSSLLHFV